MDKWLGVEIRHLAALEAIEAERSFRGAAHRLGYVQSAVSQQIAALERLVEARLVDRTRGHAGVQLTEAGSLLLAHANRIMAQLTAARADLDALTRGETDRLRVGVTAMAAPSLVPELLLELDRADAALRVATTEFTDEDGLLAELVDGRLDAAFAELPVEAAPLEWTELLADPCVLVVPDTSPLARRETPPTLREIADAPLASHRWRQTESIVDAFRGAGIDLRFAYPLETAAAVQALVAAGMASAILPALAVDPGRAGIAAIALGDLLPPRRLALVWHRDRARGAAFDALAEAATAICRRLARERLPHSTAIPAGPVAAGPARVESLRVAA